MQQLWRALTFVEESLWGVALRPELLLQCPAAHPRPAYENKVTIARITAQIQKCLIHPTVELLALISD